MGTFIIKMPILAQKANVLGCVKKVNPANIWFHDNNYLPIT